MTSKKRDCNVSECDLDFHARGYCVKHYVTWKRHGDPLYMRPDRICSIEGCGKPHMGRGYCKSHYDKWYMKGDPLYVHKFKNAGPCAVLDCDRPAKTTGLCGRHYNASKRGHDPHNYVPYSLPTKYYIRECYVIGDEAHIPLPDGSVARVDREDLDLVNDANWCGNQTAEGSAYYIVTNRPTGRYDSKGRNVYDTVYLHRHIMSQYHSIVGYDVDHRDHQGRNCTKKNLRVVTRSANLLNRRGLSKSNTSGYNGVHWCKAANRWITKLRLSSGKTRQLGSFKDIHEAARARDLGILEYHGDVVLRHSLNFPEKWDEYLAEISSSQQRT